MADKKEIVPVPDRDYAKSNFIINTKYRASLLENKLMAISLSKVGSGEYKIEDGSYIVSMRSSELTHLLGVSGGSIYKRLDTTSKKMSGRSIGWSNPDRHSFEYISVVTRASYEDNVFTIEFNRHLSKYIHQIKNNFTVLNLPTMLSFKYDWSFRLYEVLKSKAYAAKGKRDTGVYLVEFLLSELKLELGAVNAEENKVKTILYDSGERPDYDKAVSVSRERTYDRWYDFKTRVLDKGIKEINQKTDLEVSYETIGSGRGGKVYKLFFKITKKDCKDAPVLTENEKDDIVDAVHDLFSGSLKTKECRILAEDAGYNLELLEKGKKVLSQYPSQVDNVMGFMRKYVKEPFTVTETSRKGRKRKTSNTNFSGREYSQEEYDELERSLLF